MTKKQSNLLEKIDNQKLIQSFCLFDDIYMSAFFDGNIEGMEQVLRIVMQRPDLKVISIATQVFAANLLNHSARFDVVAKDGQGKIIDVEVQRANSKASRKRARFYSSMLDHRSLDKSDDYDSLPESWVIFITEHDVIGKGKPLYLFERTLIGDGEPFGDDSHILYVNGTCRDNTPLGKLMHDFACTNPNKMYYNGLASRTRFFKESKEGEPHMNEVLEQYKAQVERNIIEQYKAQVENNIIEQYKAQVENNIIEQYKAQVENNIIEQYKAQIESSIIEKYKAQVESQARKESMNNTIKAISMLKAGECSLEDIVSASGLSIDEVKALQASLN